MQQIMQNSELFIAGLLALLMFSWSRSKPSETTAAQSTLDQVAMSFLTMFPPAYLNWLSKQLNYAGYHSALSRAKLSSCKFYPPLLSIALILVVPIVILVPLVLLLFFAADLVLLIKAKQRQAEIASSLPQAIDLMLLCVDAGLGLDATIKRIAEDNSGLSSSLNDELAKLAKDILLGMDRETAYHDLYERTGVEELKSFAAALNQSSKMGLSISKILRAQSQFIRMKQSHKAEEKAARLPVWMAFPLWFCIMPSLLLILLGPSLLKFLEQLVRP